MRLKIVVGLVLALGGTEVVANAGVTFTAGNNPQVDSAVLYNCPTLCTDGPGNLIVGHLQQVIPDTAVDFTSEETLQVTGPGYNALSGLSSTVGFDDLAITVPGHTFTSIILQLTSLASATDGTVSFDATLADGTTHVLSDPLIDSHTGGNYFTVTITTTLGDAMQELAFTTTQWQDNVSQVRIGGISNTSIIPEPSTFLFTGLALTALGWSSRRRGWHDQVLPKT